MNDWLRGERNWLDLWDLLDGLPQGSRYRSAQLHEPAVIERLAQMPDPTNEDFPLEGFDPLMSRLANLEDLLTQLIYATARADATGAPTAARPVLPHIARRREMKRGKRSALEAQLTPGGVDA